MHYGLNFVRIKSTSWLPSIIFLNPNRRTMKNLFSKYKPFLILSLFFLSSCINSDSDTEILSSEFPDYRIQYSEDIEAIQAQFDQDMWETFVALCWPADNLKPRPMGDITAEVDARPVFENYAYNYDLFLLNVNDTTNFEPVDWADAQALNLQRQQRWKRWHEKSTLCPDLVTAAQDFGVKDMAYIVPLDEFIQASNDDKPHVPLVDRDHNFVWSSVVFNEITYDFVVKNKLYSVEGIQLAKRNVTQQEVHHVNYIDSAGHQIYRDTFFEQMVNQLQDSIGSIHLKTSWKILGKDDHPERFHTALGALLFNNLNFEEVDTWQPQCSLVRVGLVGMHISVKTKDQPNSIWATFEHVDNCPEAGDIKDIHYSFYDKNAHEANNVPPKNNRSFIDSSGSEQKWFDPFNPPVEPGQIVREVKIPEGTKKVNAKFQQALEGTVWSNYQLVGTQWTSPQTHKVYPKLMSNTTLETFDQNGSSCFGCHHQVTANTLKGGPNDEQFTMSPYPIGNVLNLKLNLSDPKVPAGTLDTAVYSDYMWSLLKWTEYGHLTWKQTR